MKLVRAKDGYKKVGDKYLLAKKCTKCGRWLVASTDNFYKEKTGKYELRGECKKCHRNQCKQYCETNKDKIAEYKKLWYEANKDKKREYDKQYREDNKEKIAEYQKQYREANRDKMFEYNKQYYQDNKEMILEQQKQYYENNKEKMVEYIKQWRKDNKNKVAEYHKRYSQTPQGQVANFNKIQRRRIKEEQQGDGITKDQWLEMMSFFNWRCAYSGEYLGGSNNSFNRTIDHIVPLNSGGDNMIWNCVPMTRSLNSSKNSKNMEEWYKEQDCYDPKRLQKIYDWQEYAFSKWGKDTQYLNTNDI